MTDYYAMLNIPYYEGHGKYEICIYGLFDPRTGELKYIGQTKQNLTCRLWGHTSPYKLQRSDSKKDNWISDLVDIKLKPIIRPIEFTTYEKANERERYYINMFYKELLNSI